MWLALFTLSVRRGVFWSRCFPHHLLRASISSEEAPRCSSSSRGDVCSHPCCQTMFIPFFHFTFFTKYMYLWAGALNKRAVLWWECTGVKKSRRISSVVVYLIVLSMFWDALSLTLLRDKNLILMQIITAWGGGGFTELEVHIIELNWATTISQNESVLVPVYREPNGVSAGESNTWSRRGPGSGVLWEEVKPSERLLSAMSSFLFRICHRLARSLSATLHRLLGGKKNMQLWGEKYWIFVL